MPEITFTHPELGKGSYKTEPFCLTEFGTIPTVHKGIIRIELKQGTVITTAIIKATNAEGKELNLKEIEKALINKGEH